MDGVLKSYFEVEERRDRLLNTQAKSKAKAPIAPKEEPTGENEAPASPTGGKEKETEAPASPTGGKNEADSPASSHHCITEVDEDKAVASAMQFLNAMYDYQWKKNFPRDVGHCDTWDERHTRICRKTCDIYCSRCGIHVCPVHSCNCNTLRDRKEWICYAANPAMAIVDPKRRAAHVVTLSDGQFNKRVDQHHRHLQGRVWDASKYLQEILDCNNEEKLTNPPGRDEQFVELFMDLAFTIRNKALCGVFRAQSYEDESSEDE